MDYDRSVALVGRPNVGKSRLFNCLVKKRISIVHDQPGVTRDIIMEPVNDDFLLMDTGGLGIKPDMNMQAITDAVEEQVLFAMGVAKVVVFVVDAHLGFLPDDEKIAKMLKRMQKKVILAVNKVDDKIHESKVTEFYRLGFGSPLSISAEHHKGIDSLLDSIQNILGPNTNPSLSLQEIDRLKICFAGRPNVGKSSIGNALLKMDRLIVSDIPGTTRESVKVHLDFKTPSGEIFPFELIDTAGLKRNSKIDTSLDYFSNLRTTDAFQNADVVFLVLDAKEGVSKLDKKLAGDILDSGRSLVILVNKWDFAINSIKENLIDDTTSIKTFQNDFEAAVRAELFFLPKSPILFVSAKENIHIDSILYTANDLKSRMNQKLVTSQINKVLHDITQKRPPKLMSGKRFKLYYAVQTGNNPFMIRLYCNHSDAMEPAYATYLRNEFIKTFELFGCPVKFELKGKIKDKEES